MPPENPGTNQISVPTARPPAKKRSNLKRNLVIGLVGLGVIACVAGAFLIGKHGERVIIRPPSAPPITLPPQAIVVADCVTGLGKQYVIPKDIPHGPIYDVKNSKVIAIEYNYKAVDLFLNPNRLSNTILPLTKFYQINHFTTTIGDLKGGTPEDAQNVPVRLTVYVVSKAEADKIKCTTPKV